MNDARSSLRVWLRVSLCAAGVAGVSGCKAVGSSPGGGASVPGDVGDAAADEAPASASSPDALTALDAPAEAGPLDKTILLTLVPADGAPLAGVASLVVTVQENGSAREQTFTHASAAEIDAAGGAKLSLVVGPSDSGSVIFVVDARSAGGCRLATGLANVLLTPDATIDAMLSLQRLDECDALDGGAPDAPASEGGAPFPGCDPLKTACGADMTCALRCETKTAACTPAGAGFHGTTCASDADCAPGTQCFDYAAGGCAVKVCRRFCGEDVNCPQPLAAALPRNVCSVPAACAGAAAPYRTCSVSCDPTFRGRADGDTACPGDLACVLLDADHADCACAPATRAKTEGQTCATSDDCTPGLACQLAGGARACRAVCRCNVEDGACAAFVDNACPTAGTHCAPLERGTVYGVCVP